MAVSADHPCLHCGQPIDLADTNVSTDVALCRACGRSMSFSAVTAAGRAATVDLSRPPRGVHLQQSLISGVEIRFRRFKPLVLALIPFTAVWSGVWIWGIFGDLIAEEGFNLATGLMIVPFLIGTIVLLGVITYLLFGAWRLQIERGHIRLFQGVGPFGWNREIAINRASTVVIKDSAWIVNGRPTQEIAITTGDQHLEFGAMLPDDVRRYVASVLREAAKTV